MTINQYINKQPSPQKQILTNLRKLIKRTVPGIVEEIKMGVPWYEGKFYLVSLKNSVNMGFAYNQMLEKFQPMLKGKGKHMRHVKFFLLKDINKKQIIDLIKTTKKGYHNPHPEKS